MVTSSAASKKEQIKLLIADNSLVFRRFIRDIFTASNEVVVAGEAQTGIDALDLILKIKPDVILMDMEMPVMDGMTALQHLMIHCPTPTIMTSSLTAEGTARSFDALKNGAVDFIGKDNIFDNTDVGVFSNELTKKIRNASEIKLESVDPDFEPVKDPQNTTLINRIVFCEECGGRTVVENVGNASFVECSTCGDPIELQELEHYRRNSFLTVIGGGEDCFRNLLNIIPLFENNLGGALLVILKSADNHLKALTEYLNSVSRIKVIHAKAGMSVEEGSCYIASTRAHLCLRPYSTNYTLHSVSNLENGMGPIDLAMASASVMFKGKIAGVLLSGSGMDGIEGLGLIAKNSGEQLLLNPSLCLSTDLVRNAMQSIRDASIIDSEKKLVEHLNRSYKKARQGINPV